MSDPSTAVAASALRKWREDPVSMVVDLFGVQPDAWQVEGLRAFPHNPRLAFRAAAGVGKTAELAWLGWNFLLTRPHPMIGATSITKDNLYANLWAEMSRWKGRSKLLDTAFEQTGSAIYSKEHPETWRMEARGWARDADATAIGNALRGLHADYIMWLLDETGGYPDSIMPVCENIFAGSPVEAHIVQAGNPTNLSGPLYRASTVAKRLWHVIPITADPDDPNRSPRVSIEHARAQIEQYGRDNPWVMVNLLGQFPPAAFNALIGVDEVQAAMNRMYREHDLHAAPRILAADVARQGDDQSIITKRWGLQMYPQLKYRNIDGPTGAAQLSRIWTEWDADAAFVDATGGFGWAWIDQLRLLGRRPIPVEYAANAHNKDRYFNKRTEMAFDLVDWIKRGGALPNDDRLLAQLTQTTYTFKGDRLLLEPKDQVKVKIGYSPDEMDSAMTTFAEPVAKAVQQLRRPNRSAIPSDYDPFRGVESPLPTNYR